MADGHDKSVLEQFYKGLSKEQLVSIRTVSGDAVCWITECANEPAHSASAVSIHSMSLSGPQMCWMKSAKTAGMLLCDRAKQLVAENPQKHARPKADGRVAAKVQPARRQACEIKRTTYSFGKAAQYLTERQKDPP